MSGPQWYLYGGVAGWLAMQISVLTKGQAHCVGIQTLYMSLTFGEGTLFPLDLSLLT